MAIPDFVKTLLRNTAPTLLTALGLPPPFSTIAASVVSGVLDKYLPVTDPAPAAQDTPATSTVKPPLTPAQVTELVEKNVGNPQLTLDLKQAEADLRKYELDAGIRFAEVELKDRTRAGEFQLASGLAQKSFFAGMSIVWLAIVGMIVMIAGSLLLVFKGATIAPDHAGLSTAAFGLIGTAVGFINGIAATIISFYYGSSQSSKDKTETIATTMRDLGQELGRVASLPAPQPPPLPQPGQMSVPVATRSDAVSSRDTEQVLPASPNLLIEILPKLTAVHQHFPDSVSWALQARGIAIDGAAPQGTAGNPTTVRKIWSNYGELCASAARTYGVPVELIVATIATESMGKPNDRRAEPQINDESVGLMQTLVKTAREALARPGLRGDDLLDPATSIAAGTAYIAQQRGDSHFDAPCVAAAYNAGSIRRDGGSNRWRMRCYPIGTGRHIDRFIGWFNDCMEVAATDDWGRQNTPSFAVALSGNAPAAPTGGGGGVAAPAIITSGPDFPPRPNFFPLKDTAARQQAFGKFDYVADPQPDNKEHIRILGDWVAQNIVSVEVTKKSVAGRKAPLVIQFHARAAEQLKAVWAEWEQQGLLDRILSYDGSFSPRFIRKRPGSLSCHAFGCAFDINAELNGLGVQPPLVGQRGSVRELVAIANKHKLFWGGHFQTRSDGMHFEVAQFA